MPRAYPDLPPFPAPTVPTLQTPPDLTPRRTTPQQAAALVAQHFGVPSTRVSWHPRAPYSPGLLLQLPWSRVVVARTPAHAERFAQSVQRGRCRWIVESLDPVYGRPVASGESWRLRERGLPGGAELEASASQRKARQQLEDFVQWGLSVADEVQAAGGVAQYPHCGESAWRTGNGVGAGETFVVASLRWPDAVLVCEGAGVQGVRCAVRVAPWVAGG